MDYSTTNIQVIAEHLKNLKNAGKSVALLVGAGMSYTASIPLAEGIVDALKKKYSKRCSGVKGNSYSDYMKILSPMERRDFLGSFIDNAKINQAHLYLGALVKEGYVDRILTTNFDPLIVRALSLYNIYPAVYDFASSQTFIDGQAAKLSVFYLHGQRDGFNLSNVSDEYKSYSKKLLPVFKDTQLNRSWIVIGYSGENDPVFDRLAEISIYHDLLFWIGFNDNEPTEHIRGKILKPGKYSNYLGGYDADSFFLELAKLLNLPKPDIIARPFSHLQEELNTLAPLSKNEQRIDPVKEVKQWVKLSIRGFEKGKGFDNFEGVTKKEIGKDELLKQVRDIWVNGYFHKLNNKFISKAKKAKITEVNNLLGYSFLQWGLNIYIDAQKGIKSDFKKSLFASVEKYKTASRFLKSDFNLFNNWGTSLLEIAKVTKNINYFSEAIEKYKKAISLHKDSHLAYNNLGNAILDLAIVKNDIGLYYEAIEKYKKATRIKKDFHHAFNNWGVALRELARKDKNGQLYLQSINMFKKALTIDKQYTVALNNWGSSLIEYARIKKDIKSYQLAIDKFKKVLKYNKEMYQIYSNWGAALLDIGKLSKNKHTFFQQAIKKFKTSLAVKENIESYINWGATLEALGKSTGKTKYHNESINLYKTVISIDKTNYVAYNNIASNLISISNIENNVGLLREAIRSYKTSIKLNRNFYQGNVNLARAYCVLGEKTGMEKYYYLAISNCTHTLSIKKDYIPAIIQYSIALSGLGDLLGNMKFYHSSINKLKEAIKIVSWDKGPIFFNLGNVFNKLGSISRKQEHLNSAIYNYSKAQALNYDNDEFNNNFAAAYLTLGSINSEKNSIFKAIQYIKKDTYKKTKYKFHLNLGISYFEMSKIISKHFQKRYHLFALKELGVANKLKENSSSYAIAVVNSYFNNRVEAIEWFRKSLISKIHPPRQRIILEKDFANINKSREFNQLLNRYLPLK